jgi:ribosomal protein L14E/L6E/L27E
MMDPSNGKEYSINSIIFVAVDGKGAESEGVIIQLLDDNLKVVPSCPVNAS